MRFEKYLKKYRDKLTISRYLRDFENTASKDFSKLEIVYPSGIPYEKATYWTLSELQNKIEE